MSKKPNLTDDVAIAGYLRLIKHTPGDIEHFLGLLGAVKNGRVRPTSLIGLVKAKSCPGDTICLRSGDEYIIPFIKSEWNVLKSIDGEYDFEAINTGYLWYDYELYLRLCGNQLYNSLDYEVWARQDADKIHACLALKHERKLLEADLESLNADEVSTKFNIPRGFAEEVAYRLRDFAPYRQVECLKLNIRTGECVKWIEVREVGDLIEVYVTQATRSGPVRGIRAVLPKVKKVIDPFFGEYYVVVRDGKLAYVTADIEDLIRGVKNLGYKVERLDYVVQAVLSNVPREVNYITPGITIDGSAIIDPYGRLDLNDYGVDGLLKALEWIQAYYGPNVDKALANVAFTVAKLITPYIRFRNRIFIDYIVWNSGRGGEGKTALVNNVLIPLLGGNDWTTLKSTMIAIHGSVRTNPQIRNLVSLNRMPLILDEQLLSNLKNIAGFIIENAVGFGVIGVQAPVRGLGVDTAFLPLRGILVYTNVPFPKFLRTVMGDASDIAFMRRVLVIEWDEYKAWIPKPPEIRPILGAVNRILKMFKFDAGDFISLSRQVITALKEAYGVDLTPYLRAIDAVVNEASEAFTIVKDEDVLRQAAYEFARRMGVQVVTWHQVVDVILNNSQASGIELAYGDSTDEIQEVSRRVIEMLGANPNDPASYRNHPNFPSTIVKALDNGLVRVRIWCGALNGAVPCGRRFLGVWRSHVDKGYYYTLTLDKFLSIFT